MKFARALDETGVTWARNRSQTGGGIPLVTLGQTVWIFPDFIVWASTKVLCIDTKDSFILEPEARRKLLAIEPHKDVPSTIEVKLGTAGK